MIQVLNTYYSFYDNARKYSSATKNISYIEPETQSSSGHDERVLKQEVYVSQYFKWFNFI